MKYTVQAQHTLVEVWTYTVEANSKEEALQLVEDGEVEDNDDHQSWDLGNLSYVVFEPEKLQ